MLPAKHALLSTPLLCAAAALAKTQDAGLEKATTAAKAAAKASGARTQGQQGEHWVSLVSFKSWSAVILAL
jgi:hypothetical protein